MSEYSINRLILLGNGFDLSHKLKTSYNDFIKWYLVQAMEHARAHKEYVDELMTITYPDSSALSNLSRHGLTDVISFVDHFYETGFSEMIANDVLKFFGWQNIYQNPFKFSIHSDLLTTLLLNCSHSNWVDIENTFYDQLKRILQNNNPNQKEKEVSQLNLSLKIIVHRLEEYLLTLDTTTVKLDYEAIINSDFNPYEFVGLTSSEERNAGIGQTMILNFNYTSTINIYVNENDVDRSSIVVNYIHGKLGDKENRPIFGFGDELDSDYTSFELDKTKGIFEYIKSFWYFKTSNYHNLIRFIDSAPYQIYTLGHSCGLSDRTMLNMILEHKNCKSVKIFYHKQDESNDYTKLTQEISRHFKNKQDMRRKIVPFDRSFPMPQASNE